MALLEGFVLGLSTVVFIGPVFFVILKNTLEHGSLSGISIALGILVSDAVYMFVFQFALYEKIEPYINSSFTLWFFIVILFTMGFANFFKKSIPNALVFKKTFIVMFSKGYFINFVNPFVFVFWLGVFKYLNTTYHKNEQYEFLLAALIGIFLIDLLKVYFSSFLKNFLTEKKLQTTYKIIGLAFIFFAFYLGFTQL